MRWRPKKPKRIYQVGDYRTCFALLPKRVSNGWIVWLGSYAELCEPHPTAGLSEELERYTRFKPQRAILEHVPEIQWRCDRFWAEVDGTMPPGPPNRIVRDGQTPAPSWEPPEELRS